MVKSASNKGWLSALARFLRTGPVGNGDDTQLSDEQSRVIEAAILLWLRVAVHMLTCVCLLFICCV